MASSRPGKLQGLLELIRQAAHEGWEELDLSYRDVSKLPADILIRRLDPHHERLGLRRVPTPTGDYLWLCQTHYDRMQPKIPERIE